MKRNRLVMIAALVLLAGCAVFVALRVSWPSGPRPGDSITPEAVRAIRQGMTYAEVEALMGCPPANYSPGTTHTTIAIDYFGTERVWAGKYAIAKVYFNAPGADGKVNGVRGGLPYGPPSFRDRLRYSWLRVWPW